MPTTACSHPTTLDQWRIATVHDGDEQHHVPVHVQVFIGCEDEKGHDGDVHHALGHAWL